VIKRKSAYHIELQEKLDANKKQVLQLMANNTRNASKIGELRTEAFSLTESLWLEFRREVEEMQNNDTRQYRLMIVMLMYISPSLFRREKSVVRSIVIHQFNDNDK
jgi:hypothetical protein